MKTAIVALFLLAPLGMGADAPLDEAAWLREGMPLQIPKFERISFTRHPKQTGIVAANCETSPEWWGELRVFQQTDGKIDWIASLPKFYTETRGHYVLSCKWHYLAKLNRWVLEVFDSTHKGNGSLWLFSLEGRDLRVLLHAPARGHFLRRPPDLALPEFGTSHLIEEHLSIEYRLPEGAAAETIVLAGTIGAFGEGDRLMDAKPYEETWVWDAAADVFVQAPK